MLNELNGINRTTATSSSIPPRSPANISGALPTDTVTISPEALKMAEDKMAKLSQNLRE